MHKKKFLVISNSGKYLFTHRKTLVKSLKKKYDVSISAPEINKYFPSKKNQFFFFNRGYSGIFTEIKSLIKIAKVIKDFKPDFIMAISFKVCFLVMFLNFFYRTKSLYAITGLGYIFSIFSKNIYKFIIKFVIKILDNNNNYFLFQNILDKDYFNKIIDIKKRSFVIPGTGIKKEILKIQKKRKHKKIILPARLLFDKGIVDFIKVSQLVAAKRSNVSFQIIGSLDNYNPTAIKKNEIKEMLRNKKFIKWLGYKKNMRKYYKSAYLVCFPSYHEGSPRSLIESIGFGLPVVCYDIAGNRNIVKNNINGYRVKLFNYKELANKIIKIMDKEKMYQKMSKNSLKISKNFYHSFIVEKHQRIFQKLLNEKY